MGDPLTPDAVVQLARSLAYPDARLSTAAQSLSLVIHAIHSSLSFRLVHPEPEAGTGPGTREGYQQGEQGQQAAEGVRNRLPRDWPPEEGKGELKLKYRHDQSSLEFVVSVVDLGGRLLVAGAAVDNPAHSSTFDVVTTDYFSPTALSSSSPLPLSSLSPSLPFSAPNRLADLILLYRLNILQKLVPGLRKEGYTEVSERDAPRTGGGGASTSSGGGGGSRGGYLPDRGGPMGMFPPSNPSPSRPTPSQPDSGTNDPLRIPFRSPPFHAPLADVGRRDLEPLGGLPGTFPRLPGLPGAPSLGDPEAGGMLVGPNHPLFRDRFAPPGGGEGEGEGEGRRWGGDGYLPPIGAPPGARFDPVGPGNGPFFGGIGGQPGAGRGVGAMGRGGGGVGGVPRVHPDIERPGSNSEWHNSMFG
ncbi:proteasome Inhibitor PI31 [Rhodotorula toruloides]|uniref:Proteasome Inhibitor PI31 n=1 Tax=Rhodotorula toruloides TaxID=5286 RepID=A0A511KL11_RHOTO|nr:proteasome Inhibitor PI31 [Rhodotorula toruloides]